MASIFIKKNFSKYFNQSLSSMHDLKYYATALSEYYEDKQQSFYDLLGEKFDEYLGETISIFIEGYGICYIDVSYLQVVAGSVNNLVTIYTNKNKTNYISKPYYEVVGYFGDQLANDISLAELFRYIGSLSMNSTFNAVEVMQKIGLRMAEKYVPSDIRSRIYSYDGYAAGNVFQSIISESINPPNPGEYTVDLSQYYGNALDITIGAIGSILADVTNGLDAIFSTIRDFKSLGLALASALTTLVGNIIKLVGKELTFDYEINDHNGPYFDVPFQTFTWSSKQQFMDWIGGCLLEINGYSSVSDAEIFKFTAPNSSRLANGGVLPVTSLAVPTNGYSDILNSLDNTLFATGYLEILVGGILIRMVYYDSKIWVGFFSTYLRLNSCFSYSAGATGPELFYESDVVNYSKVVDNSSIIYGSSSSLDNESLMMATWYNNEWVKLLYSSPVFYKGYTHSLSFSTEDDHYSKFVGTPEDYTSAGIVEGLPTEAVMELSDNFGAHYSSATMFDNGYMIAQSLLGYGLLLVFYKGDRGDMITGLSSAVVTSNGNNYYITTTTDIKEDTSGTVSSIPIENLYYPYYIRNCSPALVHAQTNSERVKEAKSFIYGLIAVAAAVALSIAAVKGVKAIRKAASTSQARLLQAQLALDPLDQQSVDNAVYWTKKTRVLNAVSNFFGVSSLAQDTTRAFVGEYSDDLKTIINLIAS